MTDSTKRIVAAADSRAAHLAWCKERALAYLPDDPSNALVSMFSDLGKHDETRDHEGIELGGMLMLGGHLNEAGKVREFIEGIQLMVAPDLAQVRETLEYLRAEASKSVEISVWLVQELCDQALAALGEAGRP